MAVVSRESRSPNPTIPTLSPTSTTNLECKHLSEGKTTWFRSWSSPITLREATMLRFMDAVTDKPEWPQKVLNEDISSKWKEETVTSSNALPEVEVTRAIFSYCIQELRYRAGRLAQKPQGAILTWPGDVIKSDCAVSEEVGLALQEAVPALEGVPENRKDWHPGSDGKVLDLVHPSLFPLAYETSNILPLGANVTTHADCLERCGEGGTIPEPENIKSSRSSSRIPRKPGHRKILTLFLVDPHIDVISTADVSPRRLGWWSEKVLNLWGDDYESNRLRNLPGELKAKILSEVDDSPISMKQAMTFRAEFMDERRLLLAHQQHFEGVEISLCESRSPLIGPAGALSI